MKIERYTFIAVLGLASFLASATMASAQTTNAPGHHGQRGSVQHRVDRMSSELNLTADQKTKVTSLMEDEAKKRQELRADTTLSREQKREKGQAMMTEQEKKLKEILTPDQFQKWQKIRQEFRPR